MSDTPTPRTDAALNRLLGMIHESQHLATVDACIEIQAVEGELAEAREKIDDLTATGIHSCHQNCKRPACVARRELAEARERAKIAEMQLENADINLEQCRLNYKKRISDAEEQRDRLAGGVKNQIAAWRCRADTIDRDNPPQLNVQNPEAEILRDCAKELSEALAAAEGGSNE